jgi:DNA-binding XRE family transcriptional regulator
MKTADTGGHQWPSRDFTERGRVMAVRRPPAMEDRAVGLRLRALRKLRGKTTWQMAVALEMSQQNYEAYEAGRNAIKARSVRQFADALGVSPHELFEALYPVDEERSSFRFWQSAQAGFEAASTCQRLVQLCLN